MDKLKMLNIFIFAFLISLLVQYWFFPKPNTQIVDQGVVVSVDSDALVVPNIPKITLKNTSTGTISLSTCEHIRITIDSLPLEGIDRQVPGFCQKLNIPAQSESLIDMSPLYQVFAKRTGVYILTVQTSLGERMVSFSVTEPGLIRSALSTFVYQPIYNLFVAILTWIPGHSLGWAILIITVIIRLILLVPQQHMLESQKKMQVIQPKIKQLQKTYKDNQAELGQKMMELYKKEGVNPLGSCLPLLIQMPILIGLYWVIEGITDPSNFYHLYSVFAHFDPTAIVTQFFGLELSQIGGVMGIIFALILGATQWVQAYMSTQYTNKTKSEKKEVVEAGSPEAILDPELMQKMMLYMLPVMLAVSSLFFPLGVGLYWFIGTLFVIAQQWYVNQKK